MGEGTALSIHKVANRSLPARLRPPGVEEARVQDDGRARRQVVDDPRARQGFCLKQLADPTDRMDGVLGARENQQVADGAIQAGLK